MFPPRIGLSVGERHRLTLTSTSDPSGVIWPRDCIWLLWKFFEIIGRIQGNLPVRQRSSVVCNQGFYRIMEGATDMRFVAVAAASNGWSDGDGGGEERATKAGDAPEKVEFDLLY